MKHARILLIEDTDSVREVLTRQLQVLGVEVTALPDGSQVKSMLSKMSFDLVIADLQLPDCSGVDVARFARAQHCRVILLSGEGGLGSRLDVASAGFEDVLTKPISLQQLQQILEKYELVGKTGQVGLSGASEMDVTGVIDLNMLREQMGDLDAAALNMLARFPDMMRPLVRQLGDLSRDENLSGLFEVAHSLKGAARSAGAIHLGDLCDQIQIVAKSGRVDNSGCDELQTEFLRVEDAIKKLCR